jgi:hypothetical protein
MINKTFSEFEANIIVFPFPAYVLELNFTYKNVRIKYGLHTNGVTANGVDTLQQPSASETIMCLFMPCCTFVSTEKLSCTPYIYFQTVKKKLSLKIAASAIA